VFEIGVLRRIFGPKSNGVAVGWRGLDSKKLHNEAEAEK
jgi:hypothetical protein